MNRAVRDIPTLIKWLADKYHGGAASAMAEALGVSISTPSFWKRGVVTPRLENLERICQVYGLDMEEVWKLVRRQRRPRPRSPIAGGSARPGTPPVAQVPEKIVSYRTLALELREALAQALRILPRAA